jgi:hypothetical protein
MNEAQVEEILGRPVSAWSIQSRPTTSPQRDLGWAYHRSGKVPSTTMAFVYFNNHRLVLAFLSRKFPVLGDEHVLFALNDHGERESEEFKRTYCR